MTFCLPTRFPFRRCLPQLGGILLTLGLGISSLSANPNERQARSISIGDRNKMESFQTLGTSGLQEIAGLTSPDQLAALVEEILALDSLSPGVREVDDNQRAAIHRLLAERIEALADHGLEFIGTLRGIAGVPVSVDRRLNPEEREDSSALQYHGEKIAVHPLWPNGPMPSLAPSGGLHGPLVDVGAADWEELNGLDLQDAIALMSFRGGRNFERLFSLGAQAVIVIGEERMDTATAERLYMHTPLPYPRFYLPPAEGQALRERLAAENSPPKVSLHGGQIIENRPIESFFAFLPPHPERTITIQEDTLLTLIGDEFGASAGEIMRANGLSGPLVSEGQSLFIPGRAQAYTVRPDDLWQRLSSRYGIPVSAFQERQGSGSANLQPGDELIIPNSQDILVITLPIDTVSLVPDLPHGAFVAGNLALALHFMEHLATSENVWRRKGVLFAFMDGDALGGIATRKMTEHSMLAAGNLTTSTGDELGARIDYYSANLPFFDPSAPLDGVPTQFLRWFADDWLTSEIENLRISISEERVRALSTLLRLPNPDPGPGEIRDPALATMDEEELAALREERLQWRALQRDAESRRDFLFNARRATIDGGGSFIDRLNGFREVLASEEYLAIFGQTHLTLANLERQFRAEMDEEIGLQEQFENNLEIARQLNALLLPGPRLGWYWDVSSGTQSLAINISNRFRGSLPAQQGTYTRNLENRFQQLIALASLRAGWTEEWGVITLDDHADLPIQTTTPPPAYVDFWAGMGVGLLPLHNVNDRLTQLDTPLDTIESIHFDNFSTVARNLFVLMQTQLESPTDSLPPSRLGGTRFSRIAGRAMQASIRSALDAQDPVAGILMYVPAIRNQEPEQSHNTNAYRGVRRGFIRVSQLNGFYRIPLENMGIRGAQNNVFAFGLDRDQAFFSRVSNQGMIGTATEVQSPAFNMIAGREMPKNKIVFNSYPLVFFAGSEPHGYTTLGGPNQAIRIMDAVTRGNPREFAIHNPAALFGETETLGNILYMRQNSRATVLFQRGGQNLMMLVGPLSEDDRFGAARTGQGIRVGPDEDGSRRIFYPFTSLRIAEQMLDLARDRQDVYAAFGIRSQEIARAIARSGEKLAEAKSYKEERQWQNLEGSSREAWGILVKFYPRILGLGREAVFSVILIMAILLPAAYFLEKLLIGSKSIVAQIFGTATIFALGTTFLWLFHPAFSIAVSPFIVVIAFTMILMSIIVLTICYQRFETLVRRARIAGGEVEGEEISLVSSLGTALSLGVSNLKKRPSRTFLTALTVTVLTFSIVAFVSVSGDETIAARSVQLDPDVEGVLIEPERPAFEGVLFRNFNWQSIHVPFLNAVETEFGSRFPIARRAYYIQTEGGNNAALEGVNQNEVRHGDQTFISMGVMLFEPVEREFSQLQRAVTRGEWFREADWATLTPPDRDVIIIPDVAAARLGISEEDIFTADGQRRPHAELPEVLMLNQTWRVIGILDTAHANRIRDINGRSLALVDYLRSGMAGNATGNLINEPTTSYHVSWERLVIVPMAARRDTNNAPIRSVVVKFNEDTDFETFFQDVALRLNQPFFAHVDERLSFMTTRTDRSIAGIAKILVPIILCVLIVLNTMMGTVDERKGEVGMLGAIGLSPRQISFLLLSESAVFSVLGIIFGMFIGLFFANMLPLVNEALNAEYLSALSFNFTSVTSMALALGTGLIVMIATLVPAKRAATLAAPSGMSQWELPEPADDKKIYFELPFTLTRGNAVGMAAFFRQFLNNHTDATSEDFNCRDIALTSELHEGQPSLQINTTMWLSPYDLDVAQHFTLNIQATENEGVFKVVLVLERTSGAEEAWIRINYKFLNLVRHQFLLWRNLSNEERTNFIQKGATLLAQS